MKRWELEDVWIRGNPKFSLIGDQMELTRPKYQGRGMLKNNFKAKLKGKKFSRDRLSNLAWYQVFSYFFGSGMVESNASIRYMGQTSKTFYLLKAKTS